MRERKQVMEDRADAFIVLPGGIGTLEEFFEAWTAGYLGMHDKPLVMLDPIGHYDGLLAWLRGLAKTGYVGSGALDIRQLSPPLPGFRAHGRTRRRNLRAQSKPPVFQEAMQQS